MVILFCPGCGRLMKILDGFIIEPERWRCCSDQMITLWEGKLRKNEEVERTTTGSVR